MLELTLDIETIPTQRPDIMEEIRVEHMESAKREAEAVSPPANYKSEEAIAKWWAETGNAKRSAILAAAEDNADKAYRQTALDGTYGQIAVIGFAIDKRHQLGSAPVNTLSNLDYRADKGEADLLRKFFDALLSQGRPMRFIGHNIAGFDLRYLFQRAMVRRVPVPDLLPINAKPWEQDKVFDTMTAWAGVGGKVKLANLCKALGVSCKESGIDGSKVWDYINAGQISDVADYCAEDVMATRACAAIMLGAACP